jgi:CRP/FNR family transcriptional regulator, anaerobic regulatory protein
VNKNEILASFDFYASGAAADRQMLLDATAAVHLPEGATFYREGDRCGEVGLVARGDIRVFKTMSNGREVTLYHVRDGHPCLVNMLSVFLHRDAMASAIIDAPTDAVVIRADVFRNLLTSSAPLQRFVFETMAERLVDVMTLIEEIVVSKMDARLASWLLDRFAASAESSIAITHEEIAAELGTAREVVSRVLKEFERKGSIRLARARIVLVDEAPLSRFARS